MKYFPKELILLGRERNDSLLELYTGSELITNPNFSEDEIQEEYGKDPRAFRTCEEASKVANTLNERAENSRLPFASVDFDECKKWKVYKMRFELVEQV